MASELQVTTIRGVPTGANANEIVIPTGQKIVGTDSGSIVAPGHAIQVEQTVKTNAFTTTSTSMTDITGLSVTITPKSSSSKVMVEFHIGAHNVSTAATVEYKLVRGSTDIAIGDSGNSTRVTIGGTANGNRGEGGFSMKFLDSPGTTSATTYKVQVQVESGTLDINRRSGKYGAISTITATEIAQ